MKRILLVILACGLVACGPARREVAPARQQAAPVRVIAPQFADSAPHPGVGRQPLRYPVHGVDLSRWQTGVDWPMARGSGVNFAFVKATEGGDPKKGGPP